jgi:hypothetical protein
MLEARKNRQVQVSQVILYKRECGGSAVEE